MASPLLSPSIRTRRTPFSSRVEASGVKAYTVYNHMLLPTVFRSPEEDCAHLKRAVQVWDVSAERQVELNGPDAEKLLQMTTPRDLKRMADDQCFYVPMVDAQGMMLNDPVAVRLGPDRFWVSLADSDMLYYFKGLAAGFNLNVSIFEPDVSPLAIQGPLANSLIERVFGADIVATRLFRHKTIDVFGKQMIIARSGWSKQGGFEIYLDGSEHGPALWDVLFDAGSDLDVHAGCPNIIERVEGGLMSFGNDINNKNSPFEAGLGKYCHLDTVKCLGHDALSKLSNPDRQIRAVKIEADSIPNCTSAWPLQTEDGAFAGNVSSAAVSGEFNTAVSIAMVEKFAWDAGSNLIVTIPDGELRATVMDCFWK